MHLELLKDLELMDFEGIYNVSSHPNTLYNIWIKNNETFFFDGCQ